MKLHGWLMQVTPGPQLAPGVFDMTWKLFQTRRDGIDDVPSQISDDWEYERIDFVWGEDLQDYCGFHGLVAYARLNKPGPGEVRLGTNLMKADFILAGQLHGEAMPFHTEELAYEIIEWFVSKQEQWDAIYSERQNGEAAEEAKASEANPGARPSKRPKRPRLN